MEISHYIIQKFIDISKVLGVLTTIIILVSSHKEHLLTWSSKHISTWYIITAISSI